VGLLSSDLQVAVAFMDAEHNELIRVLVALEERAAAHDRSACQGLLDDFRTRVDAHFAHEESLMSKHGYPGTRAHAEQHALFAQRLEVLYEDPVLVLAPRQLVECFQAWFALHLADSDRRLAQWLLAQNLVPTSTPARSG